MAGSPRQEGAFNMARPAIAVYYSRLRPRGPRSTGSRPETKGGDSRAEVGIKKEHTFIRRVALCRHCHLPTPACAAGGRAELRARYDNGLGARPPDRR